MNKRNLFPLLVLSTACLGLVGCNAGGDGLTLALESKAYSTGINPQSAVSLQTFHKAGDGDVPYVKLSQYLAAVGGW